jgi:hypothetical protein
MVRRGDYELSAKGKIRIFAELPENYGIPSSLL